MELENYELNLKCSLEKLNQYGLINGGGVYSIEYAEGNEDYYSYYGRGLFEYKFTTCNDFLNDEVEIIEEPKKIEYPILHKTAPSETTGDQMPNWRNLIDCNFEYLNKTICQLIDEINNLKEK